MATELIRNVPGGRWKSMITMDVEGKISLTSKRRNSQGYHQGKNHSYPWFMLACLIIIFNLTPVMCDRFVLLEERGSPTRLRFTSGSRGYYNATIREIEEDSFACDIKMGIYIYDSRTIINYTVDHDAIFLVSSQRVQDFYFLKIKPRSPLSLETKTPHMLKVKAFHARTKELIDETKIYVKVKDVNEWTPSFINKSIHVVIPENLAVGSVAVKVHAVDKDDGLNGDVYYFIPEMQVSKVRYFRVHPQTGEILVIRPLDASKQRYFYFHVAARDRAPLKSKQFVSTPPLSVRITIQEVAGYIANSGKHWPRHFSKVRNSRFHDIIAAKFTKKVYTAEVTEIAPPYTGVLRVSIHRAINGQLLRGAFYGIDRGNEGGNFQIESRTGLIYTVKDLDYERNPHLNFSVIAYYLGSFIGRASVQIKVLDGNDHEPKFSESVYKLTLHEDTVIGTKILTVSATDKDTGPNGELTYTIANTDRVPFRIIPTTGEILVSGPLDLDTGKIPVTIFLRVRASDQGRPVRREKETLVEVSVKPVNDNPPILKYNNCQVIVDKKTPVGTAVLSIPSVDIDYEGKGHLLYTISYQTASERFFEVNASTGQLSVTKSLADADQNYKIIVSVSDGKNPSPQKAEVFVQISSVLLSDPESSFSRHNCTINPNYSQAFQFLTSQKNVSNSDMAKPPVKPPERNYHAPEFIEERKDIVNVAEDVEVGTSICKFRAVDKDLGCYGFVLYSIVAGNIDSSFDIDTFNGTLYLASPLDREMRSSYKIKVRAWDSGKPRNYKDSTVDIVVKDVNDNYPTFKNESYVVEVPENVKPGYRLAKVQAVDKDAGDNGRVTYHLVNDFGGLFAIDKMTGVLTVNGSLDFESQKEYLMDVQAMDGSKDNQKISQKSVHVIVQDVNDNKPVCTPKSSTIEIPKDFPPGAVLTRVLALDPDMGRGGIVHYKIGKGRNRKLLSIDDVSGVLTINNTLMSEKSPFVDVVVVAYDLGYPSMKAKCKLRIHLKPVISNEKPVFRKTEYPVYLVVGEKTTSGSVVGTVDAKSPSDAELQYDIIDGSGLGMFSISESHGVIKAVKNFINNHNCHYWITVQAYVRSKPSVYANLPVLIRINREKVKPPYFAPSVYRVRVKENLPEGTVVLRLNAIDPDMGLGKSRLRYKIMSGNGDRTFLLREDGVMVTTVHLDYEVKTKYVLNVSVVNIEYPSQLSFASVTVSVVDDNDHTPKFVDDSGLILGTALAQDEKTVSQMHPQGTPILQVLALDRDSGANGFVEYELVHEDDVDKFTIDPYTGQIFSKETLIVGEKLFMRITATDKGTPRKSVTSYLEISVYPRPRFASSQLYFKQSAYTIKMQEMTQEVVEPVGLLNIKDHLVADDHVLLFFTIVSGNEEGKFYIDGGHKLSIVSKLDYEVSPSYRLRVIATDGIKQASVTITVLIEDLNDNLPTTSQSFYEVSVMENQEAGRELIKVEGIDLDKVSKDRLLYEITEGSLPYTIKAFTMDKVTGIIKTAATFDHEEVTKHVLTVTIQDRASIPIINNTVSIIINIQDQNDHTPEFVDSNHKLEVDGNFPVGAPIGRVYAADADSGVNSMLKFSVLRGNEDGYFYMEQQTGVIRLQQTISLRSKRVFPLLVEVSDHGFPVRKANRTVKITAHPKKPDPAFSRKKYFCSVKENQPDGTLVSADVKVVPDRQVFYKLSSNGNDCVKYFDVDVFSGVITTKAPFDAEEMSKCEFKIVGKTERGYLGESTVSVTIEDVNDNAPTFENSTFHGSIVEGYSIGSDVMAQSGVPLRLQATDRDSGDNARVHYQIVEQSAKRYLRINSETGQLTTAMVLDREKIDSFTFHVVASDSGNPKLVAFARLYITVLDINDAMPEFALPRYSGSLYRPAFNDTQILTVKAVDADTAAFGKISYSLTPHTDIFGIDVTTGLISVRNADRLLVNEYELTATASDGIFRSSVPVNIKLLSIPNTKFRFRESVYYPSVQENLKKETTVIMLQTVGYDVGECVTFTILNPNPYFTIDPLSAVIRTKGIAFDRERTPFYPLIVQAKVERYYPKVAQTVVNVTIGDENDNRPLFIGAPYFRSVDVNTDVGTVLIKVVAKDKDVGDNALVRYRIMSGDKGVLMINKTSGEVVMKTKLVKGRAPTQLLLRVQAYDKGHPVQSSETIVRFKIVNEDMPDFGKMYNVTVSEDASVGTLVANIKAKGPQARPVYYSISGGDEYNVFDIDFNTGELVLTGRLNREAYSSYSLTIKATDSRTGSWSETTCGVMLLDSNDNIPLFEKQSYTFYVYENATLGTTIGTVNAMDRDTGKGGKLTYAIAQDGSRDALLFGIDIKSGIVQLTHGLDFEKKRQHRLKVMVQDGGSPPLSSFTYVNIVVKDINDNAPEFDTSEYNFFVGGFWRIGQVVGKVQANDLDSVSLSVLEYTVRDSRIVSVDRRTGIITLRSDPGSLELQRQRVHCTDGKYKTSAHISVRFRPSNRQAPLLLQSRYMLSIQEGADPSFITVISATDLDQGSLGRIHYSIEAHALQNMFHVNKLTGEFFSKVAFDREGTEKGPFVLPIRAMDGGGKFGYCEAVIKIEDQNDNPPVFEYPYYRTFIRKREELGTLVLQVTAQDRDEGMNADITYAVRGLESGNPFHLDRKTGIITLIGEPSGRGYSFAIVAADNGYPIRESTTRVRVDVVDPSTPGLITFNTSLCKAVVFEDADPGKWLVTVNATVGRSDQVAEFELLEGNLPSTKVGKVFDIDSKGAIRLKSALDYEAVQNYKLTVKATIPSSRIEGITVVEVEVKNRNDNPPEFDTSFYEVSVSEDSPIGTRVLLLMASDKDLDLGDSSARIRYKFATADEDVRKTFSVDSQTGWVTIASKLDWEKRKMYEFMMKAQDGKKSSKRLTDYTSVRIKVTDVNDSPPSFLHSKFVFSIKEDHIVGQKVAQLLAEDVDLDPVIRYYISKGNEQGLWLLNNVTGEITLAKSLDRELQDRHELEVFAYDGVFSTPAKVVIMLNDTIDNDPICKYAYYRHNVAEGSMSVKTLFKVEAEDPDSSDTLSYSLQGEGAGFFIVDSKTGEISLVTELDYEKRRRYRFIVQATDLGGHSCSSDVIVHVTDINDNRPKFSQSKYIATVRENASLTVMIGRVQAVDLDEKFNRKISYSLLSNFGKTFSIQESTGILLLEKKLDKDVTSNYSIAVRATDHGNPPLSSESSISIIVLGKSDSPPVFDQQRYTFNLSELSQAGHIIGSIHAKSVSDSRIVVYRLESENSKFVRVNRRSGELRLQRTLDYEFVKLITFTVMANYERVPSLSSAVPVTVLVKDENDNAPIFQSRSYQRKIDENVRPGTFVAAIIADDADQGVNGEIGYRIVGAGPSLPFVVDERTGTLSVSGQIDREKMSSYELSVIAEDKGRPALHSEVKVHIEIADLNDNPPAIDKVNGTVLVQETKETGSVIYTVKVTDDDLPQNGPPFHYSIAKGDKSKFRMRSSQSKPGYGELFIRSPMKADEKSEHHLTIRVDDSGSPPQSSFGYVTVYVVKESKFAPVIQEPTTFFVLVDDKGEDVLVGAVKVTDEDGVGLHHFKVTSGDDDGTFRINDMSGAITGRPRKGVYTIGVEVTDGKFSDSATIKILVNEMSKDIYDNSVVVAIRDVGPEKFVGSHISTFVSLLSRVTGSPIENIIIWAVQKGTTHAVRRDVNSKARTDVALAIRQPTNRGFISSGDLESIILRNRDTLAAKLGMPINIASPAACSSLPCPNNKKCIASVIPVKGGPQKSQQRQLLSHRFTVGYQCICQNGRTGPDCSQFDACRGNPCSEGERCIAEEKSYHCECVDSTKCNLLGDTVTLDGTGYIGYTLISPFDVIFKSIKVSFRTEEKNGILFYAQGQDYCILEIKGGKVQYRFDYGSGPAVAAVNELLVNDGQWHQVEVRRVGKVAFISLDGGKFENSGQSPGESVKINLNGNMVFFGAGVVRTRSRNKQRFSAFHGFKGCLRQPTLNDVILPWTGSNSLVKTALAYSVKAQCKDSGMCDKIACPYFSECINTLTSYRCECLPGHKGPFCTARVTCKDRPCLNGGQCYYQEVDDKIEYRCHCTAQFSGAQCQVYMGACGTSPCKNKGICIPYGNSFSCRCTPRFKGRYCELDTTPCASSPCLYGTCRQVGSTFRCDCPLGRAGKTCGYGEYCRRTRCDNGGTCKESLNGAVCKCPKGYEGTFCQKDVNECLVESRPCHTGTCVNKVGSYFCNCTSHSGVPCKKGPRNDGTGDDGTGGVLRLSFLAILLIAILVGVVVFVGIAIICWRCCRMRKRRRRERALNEQLSPTVKYPYDFHELATFPLPEPPEREPQPPEYGAGFLDSTVLYDPQQVGSSGDSMSSHTDSCVKRPLSEDGSVREEKVYLRTFDPSPVSTPIKQGKRLKANTDNESLCSAMSDRLHGAYHWDYTGVPEDVMVRSKHNRKLSEEGSHLGIPITELARSDKGEEDEEEEEAGYLDDEAIAQVYQSPSAVPKPESRRSSIREGETNNILVPQIPKHICLSRQSLPRTDTGSPKTTRVYRNDRKPNSENNSPRLYRDTKVADGVHYTCPNGKRRRPELDVSDGGPYEPFKTQLTTNEFKNRYSLTLDDDSHSLYLQDVLGSGYPGPPSETCPSDIETCTKPSLSETHSDMDLHASCSRGRYRDVGADYDVATVTSYSSDEDGLDDIEYLNDENPRKLEQDLKALIRDIKERTNAEV